MGAYRDGVKKKETRLGLEYNSHIVCMCITKHSSALYIGMAKVLPIIDVLGYDRQNSPFSSSSSSSPPPYSDSTPITQKGSHISS